MSYSPQKKFFIIVSFVSLVFSTAYYFKWKTENYFNSSSENLLKEIPNTSIELLNGETLDIQKIRTNNRALFVHFWATWCAPCETELPSLLKIIDNFKKDNIDFLLVAVKDDRNNVKKFLKKFNISNEIQIKIALDQNGVAMSQFGTFKLPETYLFDKNGQLDRKFVGPQNWDNQYYKKQIQQVISP